MAKQWKIGTAYVEVEARLHLAQQMQKASQEIRAAARTTGKTIGDEIQRGIAIAHGGQVGGSAWTAPMMMAKDAITQSASKFGLFNRTGPVGPDTSKWGLGGIGSMNQASQLGLLNMPQQKTDTSKWGLGPPGGYVQEQKAKTFWEKFYKLSGVVGDLATGTWKSYLALGAFAGSVVAATATVANFTQAASPSTMETFSNSVQSAKATIGSAFIEPVTKMSYQVQQFTAQIEESKKASGVTKQWQGFKAWLVLLGLAKGPRGEGFKFDTPARPEFTAIAQAWRQAQMAGAFAQAKPLEMEVLQKQFANLDKLYQVAAEINSKIPTNNLPLNTQRDVMSVGSGGEF